MTSEREEPWWARALWWLIFGAMYAFSLLGRLWEGKRR